MRNKIVPGFNPNPTRFLRLRVSLECGRSSPLQVALERPAASIPWPPLRRRGSPTCRRRRPSSTPTSPRVSRPMPKRTTKISWSSQPKGFPTSRESGTRCGASWVSTSCWPGWRTPGQTDLAHRRGLHRPPRFPARRPHPRPRGRHPQGPPIVRSKRQGSGCRRPPAFRRTAMPKTTSVVSSKSMPSPTAWKVTVAVV